MQEANGPPGARILMDAGAPTLPDWANGYPLDDSRGRLLVRIGKVAVVKHPLRSFGCGEFEGSIDSYRHRH
jgi:hypothetical protein